jgi:hypothetical protein
MFGLGHLVAAICANDSEQAIWPPAAHAGLPRKTPATHIPDQDGWGVASGNDMMVAWVVR